MDGRDTSGNEADDQEAAAEGDAFAGQVEDVTAHRIIDYIGAATVGCLLDTINPIRIRVVVRFVGAVLPDDVELPW